MESPSRRRLAWALVLALGACALASLVGGGLLVLERLGVVTLRRVPSVTLFGLQREPRSVAIINTDTSSGSFIFDSQRVWVPSRSIVLRSAPRDPVQLFHGREEVSSAPGFWGIHDRVRFVQRGSRVTLKWHGDTRRAPFRVLSIVKRPGVSLVETKGVVRGRDRASIYGDTFTDFSWDGIAPVVVDIDASTPGPDCYYIYVIERDSDPDLQDSRDTIDSETLYVHDADMKIIDERDR